MSYNSAYVPAMQENASRIHDTHSMIYDDAPVLNQSMDSFVYASPQYNMSDPSSNVGDCSTGHLVQRLQPGIDTNAGFYGCDFDVPLPPFQEHEPYVSGTFPIPMSVASNAYLPAYGHFPIAEDFSGVDPQATCPELPIQAEHNTNVFSDAYGIFSPYSSTRSNTEQSAPLDAVTFNPPPARPLSHPARLGFPTHVYNHTSLVASPAASTSSHDTATSFMFSDGANSDDLYSAFPDNNEDGSHSPPLFPSPWHSDARQKVAVQYPSDSLAYFAATAIEKPTSGCNLLIAPSAVPSASQTSIGAPQVSQQASRPRAFRQEGPSFGPDDPLRIREDGKVQCNLNSCKHVCKSTSDLRRHRQKKGHSNPEYLCSLGCGAPFTRIDSMRRHVKNGICLNPKQIKKHNSGGSQGAQMKGRALKSRAWVTPCSR